jgi:hypothetical protein
MERHRVLATSTGLAVRNADVHRRVLFKSSDPEPDEWHHHGSVQRPAEVPMKTLRIAFLLSLVSAPAFAHEGHHGKHATEGKLTGEVVDITCYVDHESRGDRHATCAQRCIDKGMPVGLVAGGKLYLVVVSSHESPNARLSPYAGKVVTITGKQSERDGMRTIDMDDVQPVEESAK